MTLRQLGRDLLERARRQLAVGRRPAEIGARPLCARSVREAAEELRRAGMEPDPDPPPLWGYEEDDDAC